MPFRVYRPERCAKLVQRQVFGFNLVELHSTWSLSRLPSSTPACVSAVCGRGVALSLQQSNSRTFLAVTTPWRTQQTSPGMAQLCSVVSLRLLWHFKDWTGGKVPVSDFLNDCVYMDFIEPYPGFSHIGGINNHTEQPGYLCPCIKC